MPKLVAELRPGVMTETDVACIERDEQARRGRAWASVRVRRPLVCPGQDMIEGEAKSFAALDEPNPTSLL